MHKHLRNICLAVCTILMGINAHAQARANNPIQGTYKTIFDMLRDVPGVEVKSSNDKTGGSIVIRGVGSLTNQRPPLFVVDGSVYGGDIGSINPQDVDNISVLKDAASATAYGAQAANGVILITTKKGHLSSQAAVTSHTESAYAYFIDHKTPLKVYGLNDEVIAEGVIQKQKGDSLVFTKKRKDFLIPISGVKRVEMIRE